MRRFILRLLVALVAFGVGVTAATLLGGLLGRLAPERRDRVVRIERVVRVEAPARGHECPHSHGLSELPAPPSMLLAPDAPPLPPGPPPAINRSIVIQRADGTTVQVVEQGNGQVR